MTLDLAYAATPFVAWVVAGALKFTINSIKARALAFGQIGYGGLPSNHSAIVSSMATLIALREGLAHPAFGVAVTLAFVVMLDAASLRRAVGRQAERLNQLAPGEPPLRERVGHTPLQIAAGILVGMGVGFVVFVASGFW